MRVNVISSHLHIDGTSSIKELRLPAHYDLVDVELFAIHGNDRCDEETSSESWRADESGRLACTDADVKRQRPAVKELQGRDGEGERVKEGDESGRSSQVKEGSAARSREDPGPYVKHGLLFQVDLLLER